MANQQSDKDASVGTSGELFSGGIAGAAVLTTEQIDVLNERAYRLRSTDRQQAILLCEQAYASACQLGYRLGIAWGMLNKGVFELYASSHKASFRLFVDAQAIFEEVSDREGMAFALRWIGVVYTRVGGNIVALEYFEQSRKMSLELGDTQHAVICLINVGGAHSALGDHEKALECFSQVIDNKNAVIEPLDEAMLYWNIGRACEGLDSLPNALLYIQKSLDLRTVVGDKTGIASSLSALGDIYAKMGRIGEALRAQKQSLRICIEVDFAWGEALCYHAIAMLYTASDKPTRALAYHNSALEKARTMASKEVQSRVHHGLTEYYRKLGDVDKAYEHFMEYHTLKEEMSAEQLRRTVHYVRYSHEVDRARHEAEIYRLRNVELADAYARLSDAFEEVKMLNEHLSDANRQLTMVNNEKNELLGIVAHDLKNPLSSIVLSTSLLQRYFDDALPVTVLHELEKIFTIAGRMNEIVIRLLDVNALETGNMRIVLEPCSLARVVEQLVAEHGRAAHTKHLDLLVENYLHSDTTVLADKAALTSIVENLLSNAIKFSPPNKKIRIVMREKKEYPQRGRKKVKRTPNGHLTNTVVLEVRDEGPGISAEDKNKLFHKFARLSAEPTGGEHSTGLGLSIVKKLVEAVNGTIVCDSVVGVGTAFIVTLPTSA